MATSSKRAYAIPRSTALRASAPTAVCCSPVPPQETPKYRSVSVSVGSLGPGVHKVYLSPLSISGCWRDFEEISHVQEQRRSPRETVGRSKLHLETTIYVVRVGCSVMSGPLRPHGLYSSMLLCPWNSPGKNI